MAAFPDLAPIGALLGEPRRAAILAELMDGRPLTAGELAARAGVSPSTASSHLARLVQGGLLSVVREGRHRHYRLAGPRVAAALETLAALAPPSPPADPFDREVLSGLRFARTCYGHLAGRLGVAVRDRLVERRLLVPDGIEHRVTPAGEEWFAGLGVDLGAARRARRSFARSCVDWTERRPHLAGAVGDALLAALLERDWIRRRAGERAVDLTEAGARGLAATLGPLGAHSTPVTLPDASVV
ncbi:MAG TPA: winged helix-turn-helix domain-containing protein [Candidatus Dormibacteraeota bacterium]|jgi:DNA-binding transcriptional ArsR family regulator